MLTVMLLALWKVKIDLQTKRNMFTLKQEKSKWGKKIFLFKKIYSKS